MWRSGGFCRRLHLRSPLCTYHGEVLANGRVNFLHPLLRQPASLTLVLELSTDLGPPGPVSKGLKSQEQPPNQIDGAG
jgi:hypothetical protein